jgi:transcriptional regulator with XRE-family HTH domain
MAHPLKAYREANGLTLEALAARVGVSAPTISRIETGENLPSMALLGRLKAATGISADEFLPTETAPEKQVS